MLKWNLIKYFKKSLIINNGKENTKKIKIFSYSIIFGLLLSMIVLAIFEPSLNPFSTLINGIKNAFKTELGKTKFVTIFTILGLSGIAVGVGFKTGLFNIGVSGQMMMAGMMSGIFAFTMGNTIPNGLGQILIIIISILVGGLTAGIAGLLKAFFRIHEVVSTILINWIAFFFMKWMLDPNTSTWLAQDGIHSIQISSNFLLRINGSPFWPSLIILSSSGIIVWFLLFKTNIGLKLKMTGFNPDASKFSGVNVKVTTIVSMGVSGAIAGLLGSVLYFGIQTQFGVPKADVIPAEGFNGIAIALIGFSNPILIIPVAIFFGLIQVGIYYSNGIIDVNFVSTILGILMYITAIGSMFYHINVFKFIMIIFRGKSRYGEYKTYKIKVEKNDHLAYEAYSNAKNKDQKLKIIENHINKLKKYKIEYKGAK